MDTLVAFFGKIDERLAKQDEILAQIVQSQTRQNEILAKMDERIAQVVTLTDIARQEATAAHQATATAMRQYAETRLDVDRFIATAERVLASWEQR